MTSAQPASSGLRVEHDFTRQGNFVTLEASERPGFWKAQSETGTSRTSPNSDPEEYLANHGKRMPLLPLLQNYL